MACRTGLWKTILFTAIAAVLMYGAPASALVTIEGGTSVTFAWQPASGDVAGYYVVVDSAIRRNHLYSTVTGRNWETVSAEPRETITVYVIAFSASGSLGEPSSSSEPVFFAAGGDSGEPASRAYGKAADFDSDGVSDMIVQSSKTGYLEVTSMSTGDSTLLVKCRERSDGTSRCRPVRMNGKRWMIVGNGDYDGDGVTDVLFRRHRKGVQQMGTVSVFFMDGDRVREIVKLSKEKCVERRNGSIRCRLIKTRVRKGWQIVGSGDYNADGKSDVLLHNAAENKLDLWTMVNGGGTYESELLPDDFGNAAEVIASGDFDGDEMSDILWRDLESGDVDIWGLTKDSTLGPLEGGGNPWSAIGAGDFDGDGRDDVLLRAADTDRLAVRLSTTGARNVIQSALNEGTRERQVPSIGDFDGDGLTDLVLYDSDVGETQLWLMEGSVVTASEPLPSPLDRWDFATVDLRPPGSR
jgi:FG-GAP-like repeat/FG-GAP repeat